METFASFFLIIILLIIIYVYFEGITHEVVYVTSTINNQEYLVRNLDDKQEAANLLSEISIKLTTLVKHFKTNTVESIIEQCNVKTDKDKLAEDITRLISNYNPNKIKESTPDAKYTSYSVNKGEELVFCIRIKKEGEKLMPLNTMTFVALHELSHLMTKSIGHTPEFWENFKIILQIAICKGLYNHVDFNNNPQKYCGIEITDTPYKPK